MQPQTYKMLAEREDTYWWHVARRSMSSRLLRQCGITPGGRWLNLGCGAGGNLALSEPFAPALAVGVDVSTIAISFARRKKPKARLVRADLNNGLPFDDAAFDVVTVFNVLYHDWVKKRRRRHCRDRPRVAAGRIASDHGAGVRCPGARDGCRRHGSSALPYRRYRAAMPGGQAVGRPSELLHRASAFRFCSGMKLLRRLTPARRRGAFGARDRHETNQADHQ